MSQIAIYHASAGSGKTYALVLNYMRYALDAPERMGHILPITFTNKAVHEIKSRVWDTLQKIVTGSEKGLIEQLQWDLNLEASEIQQRAKRVQSILLHAHSDIGVQTIDALFQTWIGELAQHNESLPSADELILDVSQILPSIFSQLIDSIAQNRAIREAFRKHIEWRINMGKGWQLDKELHLLAYSLLDHPLLQQGDLTAWSKEKLDFKIIKIKEKLDKELAQIKTAAQQLWIEFECTGFTIEDLSWKERGVGGYIQKLAKGIWRPPSARVYQALEGKGWCSARHRAYSRLIAVIDQKMKPQLKNIIAQWAKVYPTYATWQAILPLQPMLTILQHLQRFIDAYSKKKEVLLMNAVPSMIQRYSSPAMINEIARRKGIGYDHFLIDEFQDLSKSQWSALESLLNDRLADYPSMLVGDVKQAIYRWRGGDATLLLHGAEKSLNAHEVIKKQLPYNWRSAPNIIHFNNQLYKKVSGLLVHQLYEKGKEEKGDSILKIKKYFDMLGKVYADVAQNVPPHQANREGGHVVVEWMSSHADERWEDHAIAQTIHYIEEIQRAGEPASGITVLVRNHREAQALVEAVALYRDEGNGDDQCSYQFITEGSYTLGGNLPIQLLFATLAYLLNPSEPLHQATVIHLYASYHAGKHEGPAEETPLQNCTTWAKQLPDVLLDIDWQNTTSLSYLVTQLISMLKINDAAVSPYLTVVEEVIAKWESHSSPQIEKLLDWWNREGKKMKINSGQGSEGIQIMTIHQSKGLAFNHVIIPFCAWEIDHSIYHPPLLWCTSEAFDLPPLPVIYGKHLLDTHYWSEYYNEQWQQALEQLNLLYVATTRARYSLYLFMPKESGKRISIDKLLRDALQSFSDFTPYSAQSSYSENGFVIGHLKRSEQTFKKKVVQPPMQYGRPIESLYIKSAPPTKGIVNEAQIWGTLVHEILSKITCQKTYKEAVQHYDKAAQWSETMKKRFQASMKHAWRCRKWKDWFGGGWTHYCEATIYHPELGLLRPDRICVQNGKSIVLDFKTGEALPHHRDQVNRYKNALLEMGYPTVEAYLYYLNTNELVLCDKEKWVE